MDFIARRVCVCLLLSLNVSVVTSVAILGSAKYPLIAVLVGTITNEALNDLESHLKSLRSETKIVLDDFSNLHHERDSGLYDIAVEKLAKQFSMLEGKIENLQMTLDGIKSKIPETVDTSSKNSVDTQARFKEMSEMASRNYQISIDTRSKMAQVIDVLSRMPEVAQNTVAKGKNQGPRFTSTTTWTGIPISQLPQALQSQMQLNQMAPRKL